MNDWLIDDSSGESNGDWLTDWFIESIDWSIESDEREDNWGEEERIGYSVKEWMIEWVGDRETK